MALKQVVKIIRKGNTGYKKIYSVIKPNNKVAKSKKLKIKKVGDCDRRRCAKTNRKYRCNGKRNI